ncbi:hypothetical protein LSUE1_G003798 [Lachnellula suecica]|uniref:Uncharacterized protein n=1 Tax=Lachnellula suecica TaxID=602035 RepID=A0A8T9CFU9_9HELO|nr:hypothetical protein LSUE1_G003798 [Lachnellula suecica]
MDSHPPLTTADVPPKFLKSAFLVGHIPLKALSVDPRVSYSLFVTPEHYNPNPASPLHTLPLIPLLIVVHGTSRRTSQLLSKLVAFAHSQRCAVLCPMFPAVLSSRTLRSDVAVLGMLEEVAQRWPGIDARKVFMMGFSGGGQFVHRFLYLNPERLQAVSVGAPGRVTRLDETLSWPAGVKDVEEKFEKKIDKEKIMAVRNIQLVVGSEDNEVHGGKDFWAWRDEMNDTSRPKKIGKSSGGDGMETMRMGRLETLQKLQESWRVDGIEAQLDIIPGVAHNSEGVLDAVLDFLRPLIIEVHRRKE